MTTVSCKKITRYILLALTAILLALVISPIDAHAKDVRVAPADPGNAIAASAVAYAGGTTKDYTPALRYPQSKYGSYYGPARKMTPIGTGYTNCIKVTRKIPGNNHYAYCSETVKYILAWSGVDGGLPRYIPTRILGDYLKHSRNWKNMGVFDRGSGKGVALKPGDLLIKKECVDYAGIRNGHTCVYVGEQAQLRWKAAKGRRVVESGDGNYYWPSCTPLVQGGAAKKYYVFRTTVEHIDHKKTYSDYLHSVKTKYSSETVSTHVFDVAFYKSKNKDLRNAFGNDTWRYWRHFKEFGITEGSRIGKTHPNFNVSYYARNYQDLRNEFGYPLTRKNMAKYYNHYATWNFWNNEHRVANRLFTATYTVTFKDGITKKIIKTQKVNSGKNATAPSPPKHAGYTFNKWSGSYKNIKKNVTVTAVYKKAAAATYTVSFKDGVTNKIIKTQKVKQGGTAKPPTAPTHSGYRFIGWTGSYINILSNKTITATYSRQAISTVDAKQTVTYDPNGGLGMSIKTKAAKGQNYKVARCPYIRFGYRFVGWNTKADGSGTTYWARQSIRVNSDIRLYAQWRRY